MLRRNVLIGGLAALSAPLLTRLTQGQTSAATLEGPRLDAASGKAEWLVVLCHGSGGDGPDMFFLASELQRFLPSAAFVSPNGPFRRPDGVGYAWFRGVRDEPATMVTRILEEGVPAFDEFVAAELARLNLGTDRLILFGFSQGSMMALNSGLRSTTPPAAIVSFAGLILLEEGLPDLSNAPPVLLVLGDRERNPGRLQATADALTARGAAVESHLLPNIGHSIDRRGIRLAGEFMQRVTQG